MGISSLKVPGKLSRGVRAGEEVGDSVNDRVGDAVGDITERVGDRFAQSARRLSKAAAGRSMDAELLQRVQVEL
ncbi:hypothetical protein PF005_g4960 [Phytophthora fragariae]|uniref:Uncharacterized protein n=2 Tax=Phytophthora TaxID=4783 RepID=A0A6A3FI44_9STRA|nr:hypothetical protein PF009_g5419 [Phytophthora fragariae]KAE9047009.1 hypothetical protein PR002_g1308 [Phytophthora rubi]KAE9128878.1 hypothetical protein PF010_g4332 [Phytophthora fragariae]KAE9129226.1 hypothetical protein PF007_g4981 [Phytophthora fragariae]KAE9151545.1 hypothetical protein PF006_g4158 [Phytophthora fragariae]